MNSQSIYSNSDILNQFLSNQMFVYFCRKRPEINPQDMRNRLAEFLKYMVLSDVFPGNILFGDEIDDLWHLWIMQTRQYAELCSKLPNARFCHHNSNDYPEGPLTSAEADALIARVVQGEEKHKPSPSEMREHFEQNAKRILSFFASYYKNFGPVSADIVVHWPPLARMIKRLGWSIDQFNDFIAEQAAKATPVDRSGRTDTAAAS